MKPFTRRELVLTAVVIVVVVTSLATFRWQQPPGLQWFVSEGRLNHSSFRSSDKKVWIDDISGTVTLSEDAHPQWLDSQIPETKVLAHAPGWTVFERLYMLNGTLYIVSDAPESAFPDRNLMISNGLRVKGGEPGMKQRLPSDKEMQVVTIAQAAKIFGRTANRLNDITWLCTDPNQYLTHYYHFVAELLFGFWRAHTGVLSNSTTTSLARVPNRLIFSNVRGADNESEWRDYAQLNQFVLRTAFPTIAVEIGKDWDDRVSPDVPFMFDRVILADRSAGMLGANWQASHRIAANAFELPGTPFGSPDSAAFWAPLRNTLFNLAMARSEHVDRPKSVITYISRQEWDRRMLRTEDHEKLVRELYDLRKRLGCEVNVVSMSKLSRIEQILLASRTTIMMGVHGNGLTALVWMQPNKHSTVMEFIAPGGFAHDYEWTARALGMVHYGFWDDSAFTYPEVKEVVYTANFHANDIPLDGALVARLCAERLMLAD